MMDAIERGRMARGNMLPQTKLLVLQVRIIKHVLADGYLFNSELGDIFGVNKATISDIRRKVCWAWA